MSRRQTSSRSNRRRGFSLFELLVSLALLSFIAAGLAGGFGLAIQLWDRTAVLDQHDEELAARRLLRGWIIQAQPATRPIFGYGGVEGNTSGFEFATLAKTPSQPNAALTLVTVSVENERLVLLATFLDDDGDEFASEQYQLLNGGSDIAFEYLATQGSQNTWYREWDRLSDLPSLLRITAPEATVSHWPDFVVRPRLQ